MYCPSANLIAPYEEDDALSDGQQDVTLEMDGYGNQYLHLVLPANRINFLNGLNNSNGTFFGQSECGEQ